MESAKNSNYVKIENSSDGINWTTLVDNLSNSSSDGYAQNKSTWTIDLLELFHMETWNQKLHHW